MRILFKFILPKFNKSSRCVSHVIHYTRLMCTSLFNAEKSTVAFLSTPVFLRVNHFDSWSIKVTVFIAVLMSPSFFEYSETKGVFLSYRSSHERHFRRIKHIVSKKKKKKIRFSRKLKLCNDISSRAISNPFQPIMKNSTTQSLSWFPTETWLDNF